MDKYAQSLISVKGRNIGAHFSIVEFEFFEKWYEAAPTLFVGNLVGQEVFFKIEYPLKLIQEYRYSENTGVYGDLKHLLVSYR